MDLTDVAEYFIQLPHNIHSSQEPVELSQKLIHKPHKASENIQK
jgi:hypothetical protein